MDYKKLIPAAILVGLFACNSGTQNDNSTATTDTMDHASMNHTMDSSNAVPPMEAVPDGAKVFFKNLKDGQTVTSPVKVEMGQDGIALDSAGTLRMNSGHHHILIDLDSIPTGQVVPKDSVHLHFGNAQTEAEVKLPPGKHKLTLQYADGLHRSYGSRLTSTVTVNVKQ